MPNSLKCRLKGLVRKGLLNEKDLSRIYTDNDVIEELEKIKQEVVKMSYDCEIATVDRYKIEKLLDNHIEELKGENK